MDNGDSNQFNNNNIKTISKTLGDKPIIIILLQIKVKINFLELNKELIVDSNTQIIKIQ